MRITEVRKRRRSLAALYLDGEFAVNVDQETLLLSGFKTGKEITDEQLRSLLEESRERRAREKALYLLERRDHSKKELVDKIRRDAEVTPEAARLAAERMEEVGLVDDARFARRFARDCMARKSYSSRRTIYELIQKGIDRDEAQSAVEELELDEVQQIKDYVSRKYAAPPTEEKEKKRMVAALTRLGYSYSDIRRACQEILDEEE